LRKSGKREGKTTRSTSDRNICKIEKKIKKILFFIWLVVIVSYLKPCS
jgi:hypothetical protein